MPLSNEIAQLVFQVKKSGVNTARIRLPDRGGKLQIELMGEDLDEPLHLNIIRSAKQPDQVTFNLRVRVYHSLRRLDFKGNHTNPEQEPPNTLVAKYKGRRYFQEDHLHIYDEAYEDAWAIPLVDYPELNINASDSLTDKLRKFLAYCNVFDVEVLNQ